MKLEFLSDSSLKDGSYLGAGKHPSPLGKKKKKKKKIWKKKKLSSSLPSRKFLNYRKILFLSKVMVVFLPAPIYKVKYVRDGTDR